MEENVQAFLFFWAPGVLMVIGALIFLFSKSNKLGSMGKLLIGVGLISILLTPWTIPFSPSSTFGHFIGSILGPTALLAVGLYNLIFSGNVPVGRLSQFERRSGTVMVVLAVIWFEGMHWWVLTPTYPSDVNQYWFIFWATTLLVSSGLAAGAILLTRQVGVGRGQEQRLLGILLVMLLVLILLGFVTDGPHVHAQLFAHEIWLAGADVFGLFVGFSIAILMFAFVIAFYESQIPEPTRLSPPTDSELNHAAEIVSTHVSGGEDDE
ncbi:MAG: hypothetical protein CMA65_00005 [Euryarchaeota archaeon]|nr:hypothetical protein [Euryarchaeota archaeon]